MKRLLFVLTLIFLLIGQADSANVIINSFNSGILSPTLSGRIDFQKYSSGMQTCLNAVPLPQGGVTRRPGTEYIGNTYGNEEGRLIPFVFSEDQAYDLVFTDLRMRVFADGGEVQTVDTNTKLLLHADGFDSYATFTDSGTDTVTITTAGNAQIDTSQSKFGGSSAYFDGTGDYVTAPDSASWFMSSGDYTIDFWMRTTSTSGNHGIFEQYVDADNFVRLYLNGADDLDFTIRSGASTLFGTATASDYISANTWYHIAIVRDGTSIGYAINGTWVYNTTDADMDWPDLASTFTIGTCTGLSAYAGWLDEFRVSKGSARWTIGTNFTVPAFPYPSGDSSGTVYTLTSPYNVGDLSDLRYVQSADTMYIVHPDYMPRKLTRTAHDSWSFTAFAWDSGVIDDDGLPPWQDINTTATTLDPSAVTGAGITITASASLFNSGHIGAYFKHSGGYYKITAVASGTSATATVVDDLDDHVATADWYESSWSIYRGFPSAVAFFEERLVFANNDNEPQTIWMSETGDYDDFIVNSTVVDSDAVTVTLAAEQVNAIKWMISSRRLLVGTTGGEWWITGDTSENAVTPTSVLARNASNLGSGGVQPVRVGADVLFVQRGNKKVRKFAYQFETDAYQSTDLSVLAETITDGLTIDEIIFQQNPYQLVWCRLSDGSLATLSYMPEHDVYAWATHALGGTSVEVESIAVIPGDTDDEVYFLVKRTIDTSTVRYIERLSTFYFSAIANAKYSDSFLTYSGSAATTITGLTHLEAETVDVFGDGAIQADKTVSGGAITIDTAASTVQVGLNYVTNIETMRLGVGSPLQSVQGLLKRINKVTARLYKSMYAKVGPDSSNLDVLISSYTAGDNDTEIRITQDRSTDGVVYIRNDQPAPLTVLALILDVEVY